MGLEEQLRNCILSRYKSIRAFCLAVDVPYTTMDSILKRGVYNAGVSTIIKIFRALDLNVESISTGQLESTRKSLYPDIPDLSPQETKIALAYRKASADQKKIVELTLKEHLAQDEGGKEIAIG